MKGSKLIAQPLHNNKAILSPPTELAQIAETHDGVQKVRKFFRNFWNGLSKPFVLDLSGFGMVNVPNLDRVKSLKTINLSQNALVRIEENVRQETTEGS